MDFHSIIASGAPENKAKGAIKIWKEYAPAASAP